MELARAHRAQVAHATAGRHQIDTLNAAICDVCEHLREENADLVDAVNAASKAALAYVRSSSDQPSTQLKLSVCGSTEQSINQL